MWQEKTNGHILKAGEGSTRCPSLETNFGLLLYVTTSLFSRLLQRLQTFCHSCQDKSQLCRKVLLESWTWEYCKLNLKSNAIPKPFSHIWFFYQTVTVDVFVCNIVRLLELTWPTNDAMWKLIRMTSLIRKLVFPAEVCLSLSNEISDSLYLRPRGDVTTWNSWLNITHVLHSYSHLLNCSKALSDKQHMRRTPSSGMIPWWPHWKRDPCSAHIY